MDELRKIRDENSLRHRSMSSEEVSKEYSDAVDWFIAKINSPVEIVRLSTPC
jgi:hypothetical protein